MINKPKLFFRRTVAALDPLVVQDIQKYILKFNLPEQQFSDRLQCKNLFDITDEVCFR